MAHRRRCLRTSKQNTESCNTGSTVTGIGLHTLIQADDFLTIWACLFGIVAFAFWLERRPGMVKSFAPISLIVIGLLASNLSILPRDSPVYDQVSRYFVALSIPLLLYGANLISIWREARRLLIVFLIGAAGTTLGALLAMQVIWLGPQSSGFAGMFAATYIGGSVNFAAVAQSVGADQTPLMAPALAANSVVATLYLIFLVAIPGMGFFLRRFSSTQLDGSTRAENRDLAGDGTMTPLSVSIAICLSASINSLGYYIAEVAGVEFATLLFVTVITVALATVFPGITTWTRGHYKLGSLLIYVFFVLIGVTSDLRTLLSGGASFAFFAAIVLGVHFVVLYCCGRLLRFSLAEFVTASNACALGPASAAAVAATKGWTNLVTPAVLLGVFGYFIANFVGLAIARYF